MRERKQPSSARGIWRGRARLSLVASALVLMLLLGSAGSAVPAQSQQNLIYFPQTGHFLGGLFRVYWEQNGGLPFFGYPITPEYIQDADGVIVQYFERARFELSPQSTVRLGDVGRDFVAQQGFEFERVPPVADSSTQRYFPETGQILRGGFKAFWDQNNGGVRYGAPISGEVGYVSPEGQQRVAQYFERGRLELAPNGVVEIGLLGRSLAPCQQQLPRPQGLPPSGPGLEGDPRDCRDPSSIVMARVFPDTGLPGFTFAFEAINFAPNEEVVIWLNRPDANVENIPYTTFADQNGYVIVGFETRADAQIGQWSLVGQGLESRRKVLAPFRLAR